MLIVSTPLCFKRIFIFTTVQTKRGTKVYTVALYGFLEHKKLMGWRLEYIARMRGWDLAEFSQYKAYSEKITERIMLLGMKFQYSGKFAKSLLLYDASVVLPGVADNPIRARFSKPFGILINCSINSENLYYKTFTAKGALPVISGKNGYELSSIEITTGRAFEYRLRKNDFETSTVLYFKIIALKVADCAKTLMEIINEYSDYKFVFDNYPNSVKTVSTESIFSSKYGACYLINRIKNDDPSNEKGEYIINTQKALFIKDGLFFTVVISPEIDVSEIDTFCSNFELTWQEI